MSKKQNELKKLMKSQGYTDSQIQELLSQQPKKAPSDKPIKANAPCIATLGEYEGKATMSLLRGESSFINRPFTFGKAKAQMIVEQYEAIKAFAESK